MKLLKILILTLVTALAFGCGADEPEGIDRPVDEHGKPTFFPTEDNEIIPGKDDAVQGQRGLPVTADATSTSVWEVKNAWEDTTTPAARAAGIAWGADSGLNWDQKFQAWVNGMGKVSTTGGYARETFMMKTPWGTELPAPALECAEVAIFLRVTFASWYNLPFFLEARDAQGRIYFGHFGMRRAEGKYGSMPDFKTRYKDFSDQAARVGAGEAWPSDADLAKKKIPGSFDDAQPMIGPDAHAGAYFDKVFLNKRVGHFLMLTLAWFGSVNLADPSNTFNIKAESVKAGDVLVDRWQRTGIGHVMVVMRSNEAGQTEIDGQTVPLLEAELASGSMPRRQPVWDSAATSKNYFTSSSTGGPDYVTFNGGIKRWRTAKNISGTWTNVVPSTHVRDWINSTDRTTIAARPERFEKILVQLGPEQKRDVLLQSIEARRQHLQQYPASCSARINREKAFNSLYDLMRDEFGMTQEDVDKQYRILDDYVFAELDYASSKTCCWNRSTNAMYAIAMDLNVKNQESQCTSPIVFMNRNDSGDGYDLFRQHAIALGKGDQWRAWTADESCPQANVAEDTVVESGILDFCVVDPGTPDPVDPGNSSDHSVDFGTGAIPDNSPAGLVLNGNIDVAGTITQASVEVNIRHTWRGDLSITLVHPDGSRHELFAQNGGDSNDDVRETFEVPQLFGKSARGSYKLIVTDHAGSDIGEVLSAKLNLSIAD